MLRGRGKLPPMRHGCLESMPLSIKDIFYSILSTQRCNENNSNSQKSRSTHDLSLLVFHLKSLFTNHC